MYTTKIHVVIMWIYHIQIFNMFQPVKVIAKKSEILPVPGCDP